MIAQDRMRDEFLNECGYSVIRIDNENVDKFDTISLKQYKKGEIKESKKTNKKREKLDRAQKRLCSECAHLCDEPGRTMAIWTHRARQLCPPAALLLTPTGAGAYSASTAGCRRSLRGPRSRRPSRRDNRRAHPPWSRRRPRARFAAWRRGRLQSYRSLPSSILPARRRARGVGRTRGRPSVHCLEAEQSRPDRSCADRGGAHVEDPIPLSRLQKPEKPGSSTPQDEGVHDRPEIFLVHDR